MARKKHSPADQRLSAEPVGLNPIAENWLARIRARLPDSGTAVVTVHRLSRRKFLVSFRASAFGETFISEAREDDLNRGLEEAGTRLYERLGATPLRPSKKDLGEKIREMFGP